IVLVRRRQAEAACVNDLALEEAEHVPIELVPAAVAAAIVRKRMSRHQAAAVGVFEILAAPANWMVGMDPVTTGIVLVMGLVAAAVFLQRDEVGPATAATAKGL